ncbi:LAFA_0D01200g1_1 [Lachancea sp. 'fantastica']|nr:LAFA_0D01200g1_1 [Lachancea sp. 'fantastica']
MFEMLDENEMNGGVRFDSMLEILPEEIDISFGEDIGNTNDRIEKLDAEPTRSFVPEKPPPSQSVDTETLFPASSVQPLAMENQQNGEIAQLWDFNVDDFMMTPSQSSDSATISAPNSYNSEFHAHLGSHGASGSIETDGLGSSAFAAHMNGQGNNNWSHLLGNPSVSDIDTQQVFANPMSYRPEDPQSTSFFRPTLPTRRSSSQVSKNLGEDGNIALTSHNTTNSIRKSSLARPLSSTSLASYRQPSSSELPRKPQVECFNCKTTKTPLWRRDADGNTMCNACGLFQKLHGTMRPLSLKSDVIRKRNTKKRNKKPVATEAKDTTNGTTQPETNKAKSAATQLPLSLDVTPSSHNEPSQASSFPSTETKQRGNSSMSFNTMNATTNSNQLLSSKTLMNHNNRMQSGAVPGVSKKSRRSSSSSSASNSSNRSSSSRTMVSILPKPSPGASQRNQFQLMNVFPSSAGNSAASSPRVSISPRPTSAQSPVPNFNGQAIPQTSGGGSGITVRRKPSRPGSSSIIASSLQQHQQHSGVYAQPTVGSSSSTISASSQSWNAAAGTASSPKPGRSPRSPFDLFSAQEPYSRPASRKSQTSLLSQQLQQASLVPQYPQSPSQFQTPTTSQINGYSNSATPQPGSIKRSSATASPRNGYMDSIQQQRGLHAEASLRKTTSLRSESYGGTSGLAATNQSSNTPKQKDNALDDLDWLKFGL